MRDLLVRLELGTANDAARDWLVWFGDKFTGRIDWTVVEAFLRSALRWSNRRERIPIATSERYVRHLSAHWPEWREFYHASQQDDP